jgi:nucleotide-binding universal stress UspA family protein
MKILLGIGGREDAWRALEVTVERVAETGDELTIAVLGNPASPVEPTEILETVERTLEDYGVEAEVRELEGDPGGRLVAMAEREGFDRIVIGGGRRSPMGKIDVGSIAEFVVLNARTSVTLVR